MYNIFLKFLSLFWKQKYHKLEMVMGNKEINNKIVRSSCRSYNWELSANSESCRLEGNMRHMEGALYSRDREEWWGVKANFDLYQ